MPVVRSAGRPPLAVEPALLEVGIHVVLVFVFLLYVCSLVMLMLMLLLLFALTIQRLSFTQSRVGLHHAAS